MKTILEMEVSVQILRDMHIICSFIEPSGVTLACDDIQNNFEADLHNSKETI